METPKAQLLEILQDLGNDEFETLKWHLQQPGNVEGLEKIPRSFLENAGRTKTVDLMVQKYTSNTDQILKKVLEKIHRKDLVTRLSPLSPDPVESFPNKPKGR